MLYTSSTSFIFVKEKKNNVTFTFRSLLAPYMKDSIFVAVCNMTNNIDTWPICYLGRRHISAVFIRTFGYLHRYIYTEDIYETFLCLGTGYRRDIHSCKRFMTIMLGLGKSDRRVLFFYRILTVASLNALFVS